MTPVSILFVCLGNICRSPMAEAIFLKILEREHASDRFSVDSAGLLGYHQGELPDSRMRYHAGKRGYSLTQRSRPFSRADFDRFDMIVGMDDQNIAGLKKQAMTLDEDAKIFRMTDFCQSLEATHVPDPYYGGDQGFENVINLLEDACEGLFKEVAGKK
ncbi:protein tyrosine phosphatase [Paludibacter propionicigenes WB4]|uniref:Protein tyrosine phosphatase n=1 Tax=Paludibacter propionicigenes (strain DSM 17365 / JCM 13257 / WB4) TaxID=694427 RepID=E4T884_PALPW|nr:low molecular weight protein-tyrosine-phosphatase [Paludibacter propionicigenes]ADQ80928.1 protein tyrosine phosphatase [Paludibacter propionicigenes WB4]